MAQAQAVFATTYETEQDGNWSDAATWVANGKPPNPLHAGDVIDIKHNVSLDVDLSVAGTLNITNGTLISGNHDNLTLLKDTGKMTIGPDKEFKVGSELVLEKNSTLTNDGTLTFNAGSTLKGIGNLVQKGTCNFADGSVIAPGLTTPGRLSVVGNIDLGKAKIVCDIKSKSAYARLGILGDILTNTFTVAPQWGFTPAKGDQFDIVVAKKVKGGTENFIVPPPPGDGLTVHYLVTAGEYRVKVE